jgi:general secretion pathway protein G
MISRFNRQIKEGFSLLEMTVVLIIVSILASAVIPQLINGYLVKAANKTALDMSSIEEASRVYYVNNNSWPANITALQTGNYLPPAWNGINPFGVSASIPENYTYNISSSGSTLTVSTNVPTVAEPIIQNLLPVTSISGNTINSTVSVPGGATEFSVYDYGSSWSSYAIESAPKTVIKQVTGIPGNSSRAITNLPYTSASSYSCDCSQANAGAFNESPSVVINSASQITVYNNHVDNIGGNGNCNLICIGW